MFSFNMPSLFPKFCGGRKIYQVYDQIVHLPLEYSMELCRSKKKWLQKQEIGITTKEYVYNFERMVGNMFT